MLDIQGMRERDYRGQHPETGIHVIDCALAGADIATVPFKVIEQMCKHPLTDQGIEKFRQIIKLSLEE